MAYKIARPVGIYYIPLSDEIEKRLDAEWRRENTVVRSPGIAGGKYKFENGKGQGWHGDTPGHKRAAEQCKGKSVLRTSMKPYDQGLCQKHGLPMHPATNKCPMCVELEKKFSGVSRTPMNKETKDAERYYKSDLKEYPKLSKFVEEFFVREWEGGDDETKDIMNSLGWTPFAIDHKKFNDYMQDSYEAQAEAATRKLIHQMRLSLNVPLKDGEMYDLMMYSFTSYIDPKYAQSHIKLAEKMYATISQLSSNWVAEGLQKSRN